MPSKNSVKFSCRECGASLHVSVPRMNYCPMCCALSPGFKKFLAEYVQRTHFNKAFDVAIKQFMKSEYTAAARTATIILENEIKKVIEDDSRFGSDLMANAFAFEYDEKTKKITKPPLIPLNDLATKTKRNEQEGMKFLCMGLMAGCRNILAHSDGHALPMKCLNIISFCSFVLSEIQDESLAEELCRKKLSR